MKKKLLAIILLIFVLSCVRDAGYAKAADSIYVSEGTMVVQRADVLCVEIEELRTLFKTNEGQYGLTSSGVESGIYINGEKSSTTTIYYSQWGLYVEGTRLKGAAWTTGDYVQIKGTFTQPVTSDVYELNFVFHCITASGTDATSSATWEMLSESELPSFVSVTALSNAGRDANGAYATLTTSGPIVGSSTGDTTEQSVTVFRDGAQSTIMLQKSGDNTLFIQTVDDLSTLTTTVVYVIPAYTEIYIDGAACIITEDFTFYVTKNGITDSLPLNISYKNCKNQEENKRWKLTVNTSPKLNQTGSLGSALATLQGPEGDVRSVTIEKTMAGDISSELLFYLDYETIGKPSELVVGTKLTIRSCNLSETLSIDNNMVLTWNGSMWTDLANVDDIVGDANGDKALSIQDLVRYKNAFANEKTFAEDYISDLNKDMETNEFDVELMRRMLLGEAMETISFDCAMDITSPTAEQVVYPYVDKVYDFLTTEGADIWDYYIAGTQPGRDGSLKDIVITWNGVMSEDEAQYVNKYVVEYATNADFTNAIAVTTDENLTNVGVNNLYKATEYYVRVTAYAGNVVLGRTETVAFQTTDIGPRFMTVDGIYNVRDLGGYVTESGKRTLQGLVYRGGEMDGLHNINLTEAGNEVMSNLMGIRLDMDFRSPSECNYVTESPISSATKIHYPIGGYTDVFDNTYKEYLRQIFAAFADESNYPIYFHCWGGADRTGTIAYLLNGLCGVSEAELVQDYELTSYAVFGVRADDWDAYNFTPFVTQLKTYEGDTLSEKIENYLLSIGVKAEEIYNIRAIMFGEETIEVPEDATAIPNLSDYWTTESGYFTLDSTTTVASSDSAIGYGNQVRIDATTVTSGKSGNTYFFVGSYGVRLRGGTFRMSTLTRAGTYAEVSPRVTFDCLIDTFETEGGYLILGTEVVSDTKMKLTFEAVKADGTIACSDSYTFTRITDEIATSDAKVTIAIDTSEMSSVTVKTGIGASEKDVLDLSDYWTTETGSFTLDSATTMASSDAAIGYGNKVRMDVTTVRSGANGDTYFFVGSYGVRLRGNSFRMSTLTSAGSYAEVQPRKEFSCSTNAFEAEGGYLILGTEVVSDTEIKLTFEAVRADGTIACSDSYTFTRISDEIATTNAKVTIVMSTSEMTSVTVKTGK